MLQISTFKMETFWQKLSRLTSDVQTVSFTSCPMCFGSTNLQFLTLLKETTSCCKLAFRIKMLFIYISANSICKLSFYCARKVINFLQLYFCFVFMIAYMTHERWYLNFLCQKKRTDNSYVYDGSLYMYI